jgi:iron transport multicopper oxidase
MACDPNFTFSIDGHQFVVIEADGENTQPLLVDELQVFPGQRYSVVLTANKPVANYWIRALPNRGVAGFKGGVNSAILRYSGAPKNADPTSTQTPSTRPLQETDLHPLSDPAAPGPPTRAGKGVVALNIVPAWDAAIGKFTANGAPWITPSVPVLLQILSGARTAKDLLPLGSVYPLPKNRVIEISMPGLDLGGPVSVKYSLLRLFGQLIDHDSIRFICMV